MGGRTGWQEGERWSAPRPAGVGPPIRLRGGGRCWIEHYWAGRVIIPRTATTIVPHDAPSTTTSPATGTTTANAATTALRPGTTTATATGGVATASGRSRGRAVPTR